MKKAYYDEVGFYLPAFFYMEIDTFEPLDDLNKLSDDALSTLFHEYVHYLQDITSLYGLINICHIVDIQKTINHQILNEDDTNIPVPVIISNDEVAGINIDLFSLYHGDYDLDIPGIQKIEAVTLEPNELIAGFEKVPGVVVRYKDGKGDRGYFNFGAACVMESMAYLIQDYMFDEVRPPYFPYKTAKDVCEFLYPELAADQLSLILICDIAYNSSHPGNFFYDFVCKTKELGIGPGNYTGLYDLLEDFKFTDINQKQWSIYDIYKDKASLAERQLKDYFTVDLFKEIKLWFEQIIRLGTDFRVKNIGFWIDVLNFPTKIERRNAFGLLTQFFGFPLMTNNLRDYYFQHSSVHPERIAALKAVNEINMILFYSQEGCKMKDFCSRGKDITSALCDRPWLRSKEDQLCPFGQVWKMWGLSEIVPVQTK